MTPAVGFLSFLGLTLALLGVVVVSGLKARMRVHLPAVALAVASLGVTIFYAEKLGQLYDLDAAGWIKPFHLTLAKLTTLAYVLPLITGAMTLRNRRHKRLHFRMAMLVLAMTVMTAITGTWMVLASPPL